MRGILTEYEEYPARAGVVQYSGSKGSEEVGNEFRSAIRSDMALDTMLGEDM